MTARRTSKVAQSGLRLKLEGQVTLGRLEKALEAWGDFLGEAGRRVAGATGRDAVRYVITEASGGSLTLGVRPQPARKEIPSAVMPLIAQTVTAGIRLLERSARRPKHFTDTALISPSKQITCYFTPRVDWELVLKAFGTRVAVTGVIKSRSSGEKVSVTASSLYVFPAEEDLPAPDDVLGAVKSAQ